MITQPHNTKSARYNAYSRINQFNAQNRFCITLLPIRPPSCPIAFWTIKAPCMIVQDFKLPLSCNSPIPKMFSHKFFYICVTKVIAVQLFFCGQICGLLTPYGRHPVRTILPAPPSGATTLGTLGRGFNQVRALIIDFLNQPSLIGFSQVVARMRKSVSCSHDVGTKICNGNTDNFLFLTLFNNPTTAVKRTIVMIKTPAKILVYRKSQLQGLRSFTKAIINKLLNRWLEIHANKCATCWQSRQELHVYTIPK